MTAELVVNNLPPKPLNLPKFVCILGAVRAGELATELARVNPDHSVYHLNDIGHTVATMLIGEDELSSEATLGQESVKDFCNDLDTWLSDRLGDNYAAKAFISNYVADDLSEGLIFPDCTLDDAIALFEQYGSDALFICTGPLHISASKWRSVWLPKEELSERLSLLRRELGEDI